MRRIPTILFLRFALPATLLCGAPIARARAESAPDSFAAPLASFATTRIGSAFSATSATSATSARSADELAPFRALRHIPAGPHLLDVARAALLATDGAVHHEEVAAPDSSLVFASADLPPPPAALYVTLVNGPATRACVGEEPPPSGDLAEAVRRLAAEVRTGDRRRPPVRGAELDFVSIVIGFAGAETPIEHVSEVDPGREGLLIETERGRVAFLPGEARTVAWAIREARRIGVLAGPESNAHLFRFPVVTLKEPARLMARRKESASDEHP